MGALFTCKCFAAILSFFFRKRMAGNIARSCFLYAAGFCRTTVSLLATFSGFTGDGYNCRCRVRIGHAAGPGTLRARRNGVAGAEEGAGQKVGRSGTPRLASRFPPWTPWLGPRRKVPAAKWQSVLIAMFPVT